MKPIDREKLDAYIQRTVDAAPPLSAERRARLAVLLRGDTSRWGPLSEEDQVLVTTVRPLTLAEVTPAPDELTARKLLAVFAKAAPSTETGSEPLDVRLKP